MSSEGAATKLRCWAGDDSFDWDPGEGNDAIDGGAGIDTLDFEGADVNEQITIAAEGAQAVLLRDVGAVRMEMDAVERIDLRVFGGTDEVTVRDLGDTDLSEVVIDLSGPDGAQDLVVVEGTEGADDVTISADAGAIVVSGFSATIRIVGAEAGADQFVFRGFGGDDRIDASALSGIRLFVQGGAGDDLILGSAFGDTLSGDGGDDVILADGGNDSAFGGPGDDVLDGGAGFDTLTGGQATTFCSTARSSRRRGCCSSERCPSAPRPRTRDRSGFGGAGIPPRRGQTHCRAEARNDIRQVLYWRK